MGRELDNKFFFTVVLPFHSCMRTTVHLIRNRKTFTICYPGPVLQSLFPSPMMLQYLFPLPSVAIPISLTSVTIPIISTLLQSLFPSPLYNPYFPHICYNPSSPLYNSYLPQLCCNPYFPHLCYNPYYLSSVASLFSSPLLQSQLSQRCYNPYFFNSVAIPIFLTSVTIPSPFLSNVGMNSFEDNMIRTKSSFFSWPESPDKL